MTRSANPRSSVDAGALRAVEQLLSGLLFLGAVAIVSLPAARASASFGWMPLWLLGLPAASLATARILAWSRRGDAPAPSSAPACRRRAAMAVSRRHPALRRRATRLLAAIALR